MNLYENDYRILVEKGELLAFEEKFLVSNLSKSLIPMSIGKFNDRYAISYHCSGYITSKNLEYPTRIEALLFLEKVILALKEVSQYIIDPSKIILTLDTVFLNPKTEKVSFAYIPKAFGTTSLGENVVSFITEMEEFTMDNRDLLRSIKKEIRVYNLNFLDIYNLICKKKDELNTVDIISEDGFPL